LEKLSASGLPRLALMEVEHVIAYASDRDLLRAALHKEEGAAS
jgi:osmoprotectant transport system ATP-binding protein